MTNIVIELPEFRLAFPNLFEPTSFIEGGKRHYSCMAVFQKGENLSIFYQALREISFHYFGSVGTDIKLPISQGREQCGFQDNLVCNMKSNTRPKLYETKDKKNWLYTIDYEENLYPGSLCKAQVEIWAYDTHGHKGLALNILNLTKIKDPFEDLTADQLNIYISEDLKIIEKNLS